MKLRIAFLAALVGLGVPSYAPAEWAKPDPELSDDFHRQFIRSGALFGSTWFGIKTIQHPFDVWITQEILSEIAPDFVVEAGTYHGGSALLWASVLQHVNPSARVITIDIENLSAEARKHPLSAERIDYLVGSSTDPAIVADVARRLKGKRVLVILDSDHTKEHVQKELELYAPLVSIGSYMIVQDTHVGDMMPYYWWKEGHQDETRAGPLAAVEVFLAANPNFAADRTRERFLVSNNRGGWLKRKH